MEGLLEIIKTTIDALVGPKFIFFGSHLALFLLLWKIRWLTRPKVAMVGVVLFVAFYALGLSDPNFSKVLMKPDNVPITIMMVTVGFFTWLGLRKAAVNDMLREKGLPGIEHREGKQKVWVWPDLVYSELIAMVVLMVLMIVWSVALAAPLEQPAHPTRSPNPAKAPWYFLGLQEMLVYFDPWLAGVVLPGLIIVGLCALPYIDPNRKGSGYYTFKERPFAVGTFLYGFLVLWVPLIVLGTFLRGPNWNFFGFFEEWDVHKLEPLVNVNLSEYFWAQFLNVPLPSNILVRESLGILACVGYLVLLPPLMAKTIFKKLYGQMGFVRYNVMAFLFLMLASLPIKMLLRWSMNLKYIVAIPEYFFNI